MPPSSIPSTPTATPDEEISVAREIGRVVHWCLKEISLRGETFWISMSGAQQLSLLNQWLDQNGIPTEVQPHACNRAKRAICNMLEDSRGKWILNTSHPEADSELKLTGRFQGKIRTVILDRTFVFEGTRWIIDYKTVENNDTDPESFLEITWQHYRAQLECYADMFRKMETWPIRLGLYFPMLQPCGWKEWPYE